MTISPITTAPDALAPLPMRWHQMNALRALADLLGHTRIDGLHLSVTTEVQAVIYVPEELGSDHLRAQIVADLATVTGGHVNRRDGSGPCAGWLTCDGELGGTLIHIYAPMTPPTETTETTETTS